MAWITAQQQIDFERAQAMIAELDEEERQQNERRIALGIPLEEPERPAAFVSDELTRFLIGKVKPLVRIVVQYMAIVASGTVPPIDTDKLIGYEIYYSMLNYSVDQKAASFAGMMSRVYCLMSRNNGDASDISRGFVDTVEICGLLDNMYTIDEFMGLETVEDAEGWDAAIQHYREVVEPYKEAYDRWNTA